MSISGRAVVRGLVFGFGWLAMAGLGRGEEPQTLPLWPGGAPGARGTDPNKDVPTITVYRPASGAATGAAVVVCPGGGYGGLALGHEGKEVAEWLNTLGLTAVVLKYRLGSHGYRH